MEWNPTVHYHEIKWNVNLIQGNFIDVFSALHVSGASTSSHTIFTYVATELITFIKFKALDLNSRQYFGNADSNTFNTKENTDVLSSAIYSSVNNSFLKHFVLNSVSFILFHFLRFCLLCSYFIFIHTLHVSASHFFLVSPTFPWCHYVVTDLLRTFLYALFYLFLFLLIPLWCSNLLMD